MHNLLNAWSRLVTARPWITLLFLLIVTVALGAGIPLRVAPGSLEAALPKDGAINRARIAVDDLFGESGRVATITLLFRGNALTPGGLSQMSELLGDIVSDPAVVELLTPIDPIIAPTSLVQSVLQVESLDAVTQDQIDALQGVPRVREALAAMTGIDSDGTPVAVAHIRLRNTEDERLSDAEWRIDELAVGDEGPLDVSTISGAVAQDESNRAIEEGMLPVIGLSLLVIAAILLLFMRAISDLLLTLAGLIMSLVGVFGAEGLLGPGGVGLIGPPTSLSSMVPIIIFGLTVDYAIQAVSHYRERRAAGERVVGAVRTGLRNVTIPLVLAAVTTIASLLAGLFSPIEMVGDFGIVAGLGVGLSLFIMLTLLPAGRTIIDRRRAARGALRQPRLISAAFPGAERAAELLGREVTRAPAPYLILVAVVTIALGFSAAGIRAEFNVNDLLPDDGSVRADLETLNEALGGTTETVNVLLYAEAMETRTLLNLQDLTAAFDDEARRPSAAAGPVQASYELLIRDWISDSGEPGDKYDPELAALFAEATADVELDAELMRVFLERLEARDPALGHVLVVDPEGIDTMLVQFPALTGDVNATKMLQEEVEELWVGDDDAITATSPTMTMLAILDTIRDRQTESIGITVAVAVGVLAVFFWLTLRQPFLAIIAVGPTILVLVSVLGTMALLDIPYTFLTSIVTALSIGIGVDYTIHVIHRYREEYGRMRDPEQAAVRTLATTGSALLGSALTTGLGFGVLIFSPLQLFQQFAFTVAITIFYALLFAILVVPPAMTVWGAYQNARLRSNLRHLASDLDDEIEAVFRRQEQGT